MNKQTTYFSVQTEIRKLKAQLAAPLNFDDASNDAIADTASEVSVKKVCVSNSRMVVLDIRPSTSTPEDDS